MDNMMFYVGIDLCSMYSQVTYYKKINSSNRQDIEPVSVDFTGLAWQYQIPTVVSKSFGKDEWYAGDEALKSSKLEEAQLVDNILEKAVNKNPVIVDGVNVMPIELIRRYLEYLIHSAKLAGDSDKVDRICITFENYNISLLNCVSKALKEMGYSTSQISYMSHSESFIYYVMNQKADIWAGDSVLFDYNENGLQVHRMYIANERGSKIVMVHSEDFTEDIPFSLSSNTDSVETLDQRLRAAAVQVMDKKNVSSVFLVGRGFLDDMKLPDFIKYICDRKRVFAGQNLYAKGAGYAADSQISSGIMREFLIACPERITTGIEMKIKDRGRDKILRLVRPGVNWYGADCSYDFIVDNIDNLELFLSPVDTREKQLVKISLGDFPVRPNKATRINISLSFTSDSRCHLMVKDKGFGEFFTSSGIVINEELLL